ncbi:MAG: DUF1003 domain-containing protein [Thermoplasmatales archaeon]
MKLAHRIAEIIGSWRFILGQSIFLCAYVLLNTVAPESWHFDPFPFIFLNLVLSFQAAYTAPIIMISQNRMAEADRIASKKDRENTELILKSIKRLEKKLLDKIEDLEEEVKYE